MHTAISVLQMPIPQPRSAASSQSMTSQNSASPLGRPPLPAGEGRIVATHGMAPTLGKYHRSFCPACDLTAEDRHPVLECPRCSGPVILGVWDRIMALAREGGAPPPRPPYRQHIPLELVPGVGPKSLQRLQALGPEDHGYVRGSLCRTGRGGGSCLRYSSHESPERRAERNPRRRRKIW